MTKHHEVLSRNSNVIMPHMDAALVRMILQSIIQGNLHEFDPTEPREAIRWLEKRIYLTSREKEASPQYQPQIDRAIRSFKEAVTCYERGDQTAAKRFAQEALMNLGS